MAVQKLRSDMGFNGDDMYHGHEAQRIVANQKPEERGVIPEYARVLDPKALHMKERTDKKAMIEDDIENPKDMWRQNRNPSLKWWQSGNVAELSDDMKKNLALDNVSSSHPAFFLLRRGNPGLSYVEKPKFQTRTELLDHRRKSRNPDKTFDLDGDGSVDVREFYFAARMDKDCSGSLNDQEKLRGLNDLQNNITSVMFVDNAGIAGNRQAGNQYRVLQQDGKIILDQS